MKFTSEWIAAHRGHLWSSQLSNAALDHIEQLQARVQELEQEWRWIPVSERLPEDNDDYLVVTIDKFGDSYQDVAQYIDGLFFDQYDDRIKPSYWQPLPQPPQEGE
jgi:hypothetical protein